MRSGATDMPLQLEFDHRFSRAIKERLKRQCSTPFAYFTAPKSYYPQVFTSTNYKDLPKLHPPKAHRLSEKQVNEMRNWRAMYDQSVPQKTARNMTTKDNPGTLPIISLLQENKARANASAEEAKVRNRRALCGGKSYDHRFSVCCGGNILWKGNGASCCGTRNYDRRFRVCCGGKILWKGNGASCCGNRNYDHRFRVCCGGNILWKGNGASCCGNRNYDYRFRKCCPGNVIKSWC
ncbi:Hypothetical predicted protein [Paramuricea clavata]|uniref:Galaxin-like repeats domain-containing protein n=1 Tax=Paramuricea clavata TaxID=317549 RepID=A0A6S7H0S0_PARCT|nr:Hypothetical predicted protein [Paramuricea clavata]